MRPVTHFLYEAGILAKTPRSGFHFLGSGSQSVAEHLNRVSYIGYALAKMDGTVDMGKVLSMCMFHDFSESRISDLNYIHQKYTERHEEKAVEDFTAPLPFGGDVKSIVHEYEERESLEAIIVKEADNLEWIISLKEQVDIGNTRALEWIVSAVKRLKTDNGKALAEDILQVDSNDWWFKDKNDAWWVDRKM